MQNLIFVLVFEAGCLCQKTTGRFSYFTAHAFRNFGFGLSPSLKYKRLAISSRTVQLLEFCRVELGATSKNHRRRGRCGIGNGVGVIVPRDSTDSLA